MSAEPPRFPQREVSEDETTEDEMSEDEMSEDEVSEDEVSEDEMFQEGDMDFPRMVRAIPDYLYRRAMNEVNFPRRVRPRYEEEADDGGVDIGGDGDREEENDHQDEDEEEEEEDDDAGFGRAGRNLPGGQPFPAYLPNRAREEPVAPAPSLFQDDREVLDELMENYWFWPRMFGRMFARPNFYDGFGRWNRRTHEVVGRSEEWDWVTRRVMRHENHDFLLNMPDCIAISGGDRDATGRIACYILWLLASALHAPNIRFGGNTLFRLSLLADTDPARVMADNAPGGFFLRATNAGGFGGEDNAIRCRTLDLETFARISGEAEMLVRPYDVWGARKGNDDASGYTWDPNITLYIRIRIWALDGSYIAGKWSREMEEEIVARCGPTSLFIPRNIVDNYCFEYCVLAGLLEYGCQGEGGYKVLEERSDKESGGFSHEPLICIGEFYPGLPDIVREFTKKVKALVYPVEDSGQGLLNVFRDEEDPQTMTFTNLQRKIEDFCEREMPNEVGVNVYILDNRKKGKHIFPCYQTTRKIAINILCFISKNGNAHYCIIRNVRKFFEANEGRIFFTCSRCARTFMSRDLMRHHVCLKSGEGLFTMSDMSDVVGEPIEGVCNKCMLEFRSLEEYEMHKRECFMKGRSGYRHVELVQPESGLDLCSFTPVLKAEEYNVEKERKEYEEEFLFFGDFESAIDKESGEHSIMSYGLYCENTDGFYIGEDIEDMVQKIMSVCGEHGVTKARVMFHNSMNYDSNFIFKWATESETTKKWVIDGVMKQLNKFQQLRMVSKKDPKLSITIGDTFQFLSLSLEALVDSTKCKNEEDWYENSRRFPRFFKVMHRRYNVFMKDMNFILKKNPFPYSWFDKKEKLDESFASLLKVFKDGKEYFKAGTDLKKAYEQAKHVGEVFRCEKAKDYHDIYLACDVLQLADIFMHAQQAFMETHHVILSKYVGMPSATWHAFLRNDPDLVLPLYRSAHEALFFKAMTRGGVTCASKRYARADGKTSSIIYLDVNGLYPYVMREKYPYGYLQLVNVHECEGELAQHYIENLIEDCESKGNCGFCAEIDLIYPRSLHRDTDDFPYAPEHRDIPSQDYEASAYMKRWHESNPDDDMPHFKGLVATLQDKKHYCTHWRILQWYIKRGMIVNKVYTIVKFEEKNYLASYVEKNIRLRNERTDPMGKIVYKLAGNALYGKTFENPFNHGKCMVVRDKGQLQQLLEEGNIAQIGYMNGESTVVKMDGEKVILNKPTYIGAIVTEYAKLHMYKLFYEKIIPMYGRENVELLYTDTDSFIIRIVHPPEITSTEELFKDIQEREPDLIGSIGGQVKSETGNKYGIEVYIGLRAKSYYYRTEDGKVCQKAKGTTHAAQEELTLKDYAEALFKMATISKRNLLFKRTGFTVHTLENERRALSGDDGKRVVLADGISTHAFGYNPLPSCPGSFSTFDTTSPLSMSEIESIISS